MCARVVQQQDATNQVETAVQLRPPRSNIKALRVEPVLPRVVQDIVTQRHYLHSMPAATRKCFGVYCEKALVGAVVFTSGARQGHNLLAAIKPQEMATLARLWLVDDLPKNAESRVIGFVLRYIRQHTDWKLLLSYADPNAGHVGTIYQATGWLYLGQQEPSSYLDLGDGKLLHPRTVYERYGSNAVGHLRRTGINATRRTVAAKHRYAYVLHPAWRWRLRGMARPYPTKTPETQP